MKLQNIAIAFSAIVSPLTISAISLETFGEYQYCNNCDSNYVDSDGAWYYSSSNNYWCKVRDDSCITPTRKCESVGGYPCCENSSSKVYYVDYDGEWGVENNDWCFIKSLPSLGDDVISVESTLNVMPVALPNGTIGKSNRAASFRFTVLPHFFDNYELEGLLLNGHEISLDDIKYTSDQNTFYFSSYYYETYVNDYKIMFREKLSNQKYLQLLSSALRKLQ